MLSSKYYSPAEYEAMESDKLPFRGKCNLTITEMKVLCAKCGEPTSNVKIKIIDRPNCLEFQAVGVCWHCNAVTTSNRGRWYPDGRVLWQNDQGGWYESHVKSQKWWRKLICWFSEKVS